MVEDWVQALVLSERLDCVGNPNIALESAGLAEARKRLDRWKGQPFYRDGLSFEERLRIDGISERDLIAILAETTQNLADRVRAVPAWIPWIEECHSLPRVDQDGNRGDFGGFLNPMLGRARADLQERLGKIRDLPSALGDIDSLVEKLVPGLIWKMSSIADRVLVLELNVARIEGTLTGDTPEARYRSFIEKIAIPRNGLKILKRYPVLARKLAEASYQWIVSCWELINHLASDWTLLEDRLIGVGAGCITEVSLGNGDFHRAGRSVAVVSFHNGRKVVYKPRTLDTDKAFQDLLQWINSVGWEPSLGTVTVLNREGYGWMEYVDQRPCFNVAELHRFYFRQGAYLALLYALDATDFHFENVIASGEQPVLVDLETLFQPKLDYFDDKDPAYGPLNSSVFRIGLLPQRISIRDAAQATGVDISGLGGVSGQQTPVPVLRWQKAATDEMTMVSERVPLPEQRNRPTLADRPVDLYSFSCEILSGFASMYRRILESADVLLGTNGHLAAFARSEIRVVLRPTEVYARILRDSYHPDVMSSGVRRDQLFDCLWSGQTSSPGLIQVIRAEYEDLQNGDIPLFTSRPDSRSIWTASGTEIPDFLRTSGMAAVRTRIETMGDDDLARQMWFIQSSLTASVSPASEIVEGAPTLPIDSGRERTGDPLEAARVVGDRLVALAHISGEETWWPTAEPINETSPEWAIKPLGFDLYGGLAGIVLFLAFLGEETREERYIVLARSAFSGMRRRIDAALTRRSRDECIGAFNGMGGWVYLLLHLGILWREPVYLDWVGQLIAILRDRVSEDQDLDIISGSAGLIAVMLAVHEAEPRSDALALLSDCASHICSQNLEQQHGFAWQTRMEAIRPLTGFSHGVAGIAWALDEAAAVTGNGAFRRVAVAAIEYERATFSATDHNWPDYRIKAWTEDRSADFHSANWCHGAAGIGLARILMFERHCGPDFRQEIENAVETTKRIGFGHSHCLCHGDLGNLELLFLAAAKLCNPGLERTANMILRKVADAVSRGIWRCGTFRGIETPGLLNGLAGIGMGLLRRARPDRCPCVLTLQGPSAARPVSPPPQQLDMEATPYVQKY